MSVESVAQVAVKQELPLDRRVRWTDVTPLGTFDAAKIFVLVVPQGADMRDQLAFTLSGSWGAYAVNDSYGDVIEIRLFRRDVI